MYRVEFIICVSHECEVGVMATSPKILLAVSGVSCDP